MNCDVRVAVHAVGILNSLVLLIARQMKWRGAKSKNRRKKLARSTVLQTTK